MAAGGAQLMVTLVAPHQIKQVWTDVWEKIHSAVDLENERDVFDDLEAGNRFLLLAGDGVAVGRACGDFFEVNYVGGYGIHGWKQEMNEAIALLAKECGCKRVVAFGRKGWERIWPEYRNTQQMIFIRDL